MHFQLKHTQKHSTINGQQNKFVFTSFLLWIFAFVTCTLKNHIQFWNRFKLYFKREREKKKNIWKQNTQRHTHDFFLLWCLILFPLHFLWCTVICFRVHFKCNALVLLLVLYYYFSGNIHLLMLKPYRYIKRRRSSSRIFDSSIFTGAKSNSFIMKIHTHIHIEYLIHILTQTGMRHTLTTHTHVRTTH